MAFCFICNARLLGERTRICSSVAPRSKVPFPEKIVELLGEEFVVIVSGTDYMCSRCTSLLVHIDKLESDMELVKNVLLTNIKKKYELQVSDQLVETLDIVDEHSTTDEPRVDQRNVPGGSGTRNNSVGTSLKMTRKDIPKLKIYKCGFCKYQSKIHEHVRFHVRSHTQKKGPSTTIAKGESSLQSNACQRKQVFRCQECASSFESKTSCIDHIHSVHRPALWSLNEHKKTEDISETVVKSAETPKTCEGRQQTESAVYVIEGQADNSTVVIEVLSNNSVSTNGTFCEEQESQEIDEETIVLQNGMLLQDEPAREIAGNVGEPNIVVVTNEYENVPEDLDIEAILAAIHRGDSSPNTGNA